MNTHRDTIFALSSPVGKSALSVVRVSGEKSIWVAEKLTKNKFKTFKHRSAYLSNIYSINNNLIDKAVLVFYKSPHSYTGENLFEITVHGNPIIVDVLFETLTNLGLRLANPGEFTSRAYHNKKIDLVQAESTLSVINAKSKKGVRSSLLGVAGKLSDKLEETKKLLVLSLSELEYELDISEVDNSNLVIKRAQNNIKKTITKMEKLIKTHHKSCILTDGARIAIVGPPNVGKSTLLNSLIEKEKAIVTDVPGTTRDTIESFTYFSNFPVVLIDTAGIRQTTDKIERIGIKRTKDEIKSSDIIFNIQPNTATKTNATDPHKTINVINKSDLMTTKEKKTLQKRNPSFVIVSAKNKKGLNRLKSKTIGLLKTKTDSTEPFYLSSKRQQKALIQSKKHLKVALKKENIYELEIVAQNIRMALSEFDWVLGKTTSDDILNSVFSDFCVGK